MASEGYIGHGQMRSCMNSPAAPSDPITGTFVHQCPGPRARIRRGADLSDHQFCGTATGKVKAGGPIGHTRWCQRRRVLLGFHDGHAPNQGVDDRQPGHGTTKAGRFCRWTGTRSTRTTAARPTCRWRQQQTPRRGQCPVRRRQRPFHQEFDQPRDLEGPWHDRRRRGHQLRSVLIDRDRRGFSRGPRAPSARPHAAFPDRSRTIRPNHEPNADLASLASRPPLARLPAAAAVRLAAGLGTALIPVKGKVTYKGQPLTKGSVRFEPDGFGRSAQRSAAIRWDIRALNVQGGDGVVAGHHRVSITEVDKSLARDRSFKKYASPNSGLTAEVERENRPSSTST